MDRYRMLPSYRFHEVEGTSPLTLDKSVGKPLRDYKIYGNSIQDGTPAPENPIEIKSVGNKTINLFDEKLLLKHRNVEKNEQGYLVKQYPAVFDTTTGYDSTRAIVDSLKSILKPNVPYTAARKIANYIAGADGGIVIRSSTDALLYIGYGTGVGLSCTTFSFTQEQIDSISNIYIYGRAGDNPILFEYIQLVEGSYTVQTMPAYEPYGYKIPIDADRKNLFDIDAFLALPNASKYYKKDEDNNLVQVIQDFRQYAVVPVYMELPPGTYTVSLIGATDDFWLVCVNDAVVSDTFTLTETSPVKIKSYYQAGTVVGKFQLERGDTATEYEPYRKDINIYLDEPLHKIGDYADYIDFKNGKVVRKIGKYAFTGAEPTAGGVDTNNITFGMTVKIPNLSLRGGERYGLCDRLPHGKFDYPVVVEQFSFWTSANHPYVYIHFLKESFPDLEEYSGATTKQILKGWYDNGEPMILYYELETPTETPITLPTIPTHKGTNVISVATDIQPSNIQTQYYK